MQAIKLGVAFACLFAITSACFNTHVKCAPSDTNCDLTQRCYRIYFASIQNFLGENCTGIVANYAKNCAAKLEISDADFAKLGKYGGLDQPDDVMGSNGNDIWHCFLVQTGILDPNTNKLNPEMDAEVYFNAATPLQKTIFKTSLKKCQDEFDSFDLDDSFQTCEIEACETALAN